MEISKQVAGEAVEIRVKGRLDAYWADDLGRTLDEVIREGVHQIRLNLADTAFLSSAGIRVLMTAFKQLKGIRGSFAVVEPSESVRKVLMLSGLSALLIQEAGAGSSTAVEPRAAPAAPAARPVRQIDQEGAQYEVHEARPGATLTCQTVGNPALLLGGRFRREDCRTMSFPDATFALGLGALGTDFEDCRRRFGEFLAVGGAAAYLPTDGSNVPDYLVSHGTSVPELDVCYALTCQGTFAHLARFQSKPEAGPVPLTGLARTALAISGSDRAGIVLIAETSGLLGAALRRSPAEVDTQAFPFDHPQVREWLSFTAEHAFARCLALVVGVVVRGEGGPLAPFLRPLGQGQALHGHFHAAAFSYRPIPRGEIDLKSTIVTLFENQPLQGLLHLLTDDRELVGAGQSEFVRGACWVGPIGEIVVERT